MKYMCVGVYKDKKTGEVSSKLSPFVDYENEKSQGTFLNGQNSIQVHKQLAVGQCIEINFDKLF